MHFDALRQSDLWRQSKRELDWRSFRQRAIYVERYSSRAYIACLCFFLTTIRKFHSEGEPQGKPPRRPLLLLRLDTHLTFSVEEPLRIARRYESCQQINCTTFEHSFTVTFW